MHGYIYERHITNSKILHFCGTIVQRIQWNLWGDGRNYRNFRNFYTSSKIGKKNREMAEPTQMGKSKCHAHSEIDAPNWYAQWASPYAHQSNCSPPSLRTHISYSGSVQIRGGGVLQNVEIFLIVSQKTFAQ